MTLPTSPYLSYVQQSANAAGIPWEIVAGLITRENAGWIPSAVNHNNNGTTDFGITQLNDRYHPTTYQMTPQEQIDTTIGILKQNFSKFGNWFDSIRAYNAGPTGASNNSSQSAGYATDVLNNAVSYGYQADNTKDAVISGAPISPQAIAPTIDLGGATTIDLGGANTDTPTPTPTPAPMPTGLAGAVSSGIHSVLDPITNGISTWWQNLLHSLSSSWNHFTTWLAASSFNWVIVAVGGLIVITTISGTVGSTPAGKAVGAAFAVA